MTDCEKADALLRTMDMQFQKLRQSRDIEFKINLSIWTALIVLGKFLADQKVQLNAWDNRLIYFIFVAVISISHYFLWMSPIQRSQDRDSEFIGACRREVQSLIGTTIDYPHLEQKWKCFEVGFTVFIFVILGIILWA